MACGDQEDSHGGNESSPGNHNGSGDNGSGDSGSGDSGTDDNETGGNGTGGDVDHDALCAEGPLAEPLVGCKPAMPASTGDVRDDCVARINQFRWECQCLPPLERWVDGEKCADKQAAHDAKKNSAHDGFKESICSPRGWAQNECPGWGSWDRVNENCLQMMWDEGPGKPYAAHGHYINMSSTSYTKVACGEGGGWFVQNFE